MHDSAVSVPKCKVTHSRIRKRVGIQALTELWTFFTFSLEAVIFSKIEFDFVQSICQPGVKNEG